MAKHSNYFCFSVSTFEPGRGVFEVLLMLANMLERWLPIWLLKSEKILETMKGFFTEKCSDTEGKTDLSKVKKGRFQAQVSWFISSLLKIWVTAGAINSSGAGHREKLFVSYEWAGWMVLVDKFWDGEARGMEIWWSSRLSIRNIKYYASSSYFWVTIYDWKACGDGHLVPEKGVMWKILKYCHLLVIWKY